MSDDTALPSVTEAPNGSESPDDSLPAFVAFLAQVLTTRVELRDHAGQLVATAGDPDTPLTDVLTIEGPEGPVGSLALGAGAPSTGAQAASVQALARLARAILIERKERLAQRASASERVLQTLLELLPVGVVYVPRKGSQGFANVAAAQMTGPARPQSPTDRPSEAPSRVRDSETYRRLSLGETPVRLALERGHETHETEFALDTDAAGESRVIRVSVRPVRDGDEILGAVAVLSDITAERELRRVVVEAVDCGVLLHDAAGSLQLVNQAAMRMLDVTSAEQTTALLARQSDGWSPAGVAPWVQLRDQGGASTTATIDCQTLLGRRISLQAASRALFRPDGALRRVVTTLTDITESRRARLALEQSEQRFRTVFEQAGIGMAILDRSGRIVTANDQLRQFVGRAALEGQEFVDLLDSAVREQPIEAVTAFVDGRASSVRADFRFLSATELERWGHVTLSNVQSGPDEAPFFLAMVADISERKLAEQRLAALSQAEKLRALGQMASGVAHDLNQYLGLVSGHGELALLALDQPTADLTRLRESLGIIVQAAFDGADAVHRLQAFARSRPEGPSRPVDVSELLREVAKLTAPQWRDAAQHQGRPIALQVETEGEAIVDGWPESLREAFTNLVFNAVDALPAGGTIWLSAVQRNGEVQVIVADDGVGMSPEVQARVFEPFFTTKGERGSGLGLSIVYTTVERHRGRISIDSAPGRGTAFRIVFPTAATARGLASETGTSARPQGLRILAVDDDPALAAMLALMLQSDGHDVVVAWSGEAALDILSEDRVDVVLSDLGLGAGMNGWELVDQVRQRFPGVRIALATGWGAEIDEAEARQRGVDAILSKPYRLADLRAALAAAVAED